ncbi:MAG: hypothetical protein J0L99_02610 [Chitinophagales bacterium]|nr:hypothetical protein [Chitinophagales bacterium]
MLKKNFFIALNLLLLGICLTLGFAMQSASDSNNKGAAPQAMVSSAEAWKSIQAEVPTGIQAASAESFLALTPRKIKAETGHKLSVKEVVALKIAQKKLKKAMAAEKMPPDGNGTAGLVSIITGGAGCLLGLLGFWCPILALLAIAAAICGIVFGIIGMNSGNRTLAVIGLILGAVTLAALVFGILGLFAFYA